MEGFCLKFSIICKFGWIYFIWNLSSFFFNSPLFSGRERKIRNPFEMWIKLLTVEVVNIPRKSQALKCVWSHLICFLFCEHWTSFSSPSSCPAGILLSFYGLKMCIKLIKLCEMIAILDRAVSHLSSAFFTKRCDTGWTNSLTISKMHPAFPFC